MLIGFFRITEGDGTVESVLRTVCRVMVHIAWLSLISACSSSSLFSRIAPSIPDFQSSNDLLTAEQARQSINDDDLLHVSDQMIAFVDPYLSKRMPPWQRATMLNTVLRSPAFLNIDYQVEKTLTAEQAFITESANCIGFANLYIALARHYGLDANYQLVKRFPQWNLEDGSGDVMMSLAIHINSTVMLPQGRRMIVDVTSRYADQLSSAQQISDNTAKALYYNNLAIDQFAERRYSQAYAYLAKAISFDARLDLLWVNLGAVFRRSGQLAKAESAYLTALHFNAFSYTAMNNLAVLYKMQKNWELFDVYMKKSHRYRQRNPYYQLQLALEAEREHNYKEAINRIRKAIKLKGNEPEFHRVLARLNQLSASLSTHHFDKSALES